MCATVQEIMNGNHLWNDRMTKGNTICPRPFHGGGIRNAIMVIKKLKCLIINAFNTDHFSSASHAKTPIPGIF
jgi:hypothetical protein